MSDFDNVPVGDIPDDDGDAPLDGNYRGAEIIDGAGTTHRAHGPLDRPLGDDAA